MSRFVSILALSVLIATSALYLFVTRYSATVELTNVYIEDIDHVRAEKFLESPVDPASSYILLHFSASVTPRLPFSQISAIYIQPHLSSREQNIRFFRGGLKYRSLPARPRESHDITTGYVLMVSDGYIDVQGVLSRLTFTLRSLENKWFQVKIRNPWKQPEAYSR